MAGDHQALGTVRELPAGLVTFLMTDIEGSTRLQQRLGAGYAAVIADHDALLEAAIAAHAGQVVDHTGDGLFAVFPSAAGAVQACADAQRGLADHVWPAGEAVLVRMGLHSAVAEPIGQAYVSLAVNRTARVTAAGHGGQVLLTRETVEAAGNALDVVRGGLSTRELGIYRLKDFDDPIPLLQLTGEQLVASFPSLRALPAAAHNVPTILTEFVGRTEELEALDRLVDDHRLVTVVGPGGVGKTRLAFELARQRAPAHRAGAWVVLLAGVSDPSLVVSIVATSLGVPETGGSGLLERLALAVGQRQLLLVIDNCEHLLEATAQVVQAMLEAGTELRIVVTSREPLRVPGEHIWRLEPLALPDTADLDALWASDSVRLFVERARAADARFELSPATAEAVASIVRELDGIPLALELAAARTRHLPVRAVASRLQNKFTLLRSTDRIEPGAAAHHTTLTATLDWSHSLLDDDERIVFRRLAVFQVPFTLEAAEYVVSDTDLGGRDVIEVLSALVDKSLLAIAESQELTYRMLVVIRDYAMVALEASGEKELACSRHLTWVCDAIACAPVSPVDQPGRADWQDVVEGLMPDIRIARLHAEQTGDSRAMVMLAARVGRWGFRSFRLREAAAWTLATCDLAEPDPPVVYGWLMYSAVLLAFATEVPTEEAHALLARLETWTTGFADASPEFRAFIWHLRGDSLRRDGDCESAITAFTRALELAVTDLHRATLRRTIADCLFELGELDQALTIDDEVIAEFERLGDPFEIFRTLPITATHLAAAGATYHPRAAQLARQSIGIACERGWGIPIEPTLTLAQIAQAHGDLDGAVRALTSILKAAEDAPSESFLQRVDEAYAALDDLAAVIDPSTFACLVAEGRSLTPVQAADLILVPDPVHATSPSVSTGPVLTR